MKLMPGEFFEMPSAVFQMDLTPEELATYAYLRCRKNNRTHKCWPSYKTIGEAIGRSRKSVAKYVSGLEEKGLIKTENTEMIHKGRRAAERKSDVHHPADPPRDSAVQPPPHTPS